MRKIRIESLVLTVMLLPLLGIVPASAEERVLEIGKWYPELEAGINLTQSAYSDNWSGGDQGSVVWTFIANASLENQLKPKLNWSNVLKLAYGQTHQQKTGEGGRKYWEKPTKSTDRIDLESILRFTLHSWVDPYVSARLESQFQDASDPYGRSLSLNPMLFKESAGIARKLIDEEERSLLTRLGFTLRQSRRKVFTSPNLLNPDLFEADTVSESTTDGGLEWVTDYKTKILQEKVAWTSKLGFYQPFFYSGKGDLEDLTAAQLTAAGLDGDVANYTTTVDIDWENIFTTQITDVISVNLYVRWVYDKYDNSVKPILDDAGDVENPAEVAAAIRKAGQLKETLAIGITYRFF